MFLRGMQKLGISPLVGFNHCFDPVVSTQMTFSAGEFLNLILSHLFLLLNMKKWIQRSLTLLEVIQSQDPGILGLTGFFSQHQPYRELKRAEKTTQTQPHHLGPLI